jgi:hypothetical protein
MNSVEEYSPLLVLLVSVIMPICMCLFFSKIQSVANKIKSGFAIRITLIAISVINFCLYFLQEFLGTGSVFAALITASIILSFLLAVFVSLRAWKMVFLFTPNIFWALILLYIITSLFTNPINAHSFMMG